MKSIREIAWNVTEPEYRADPATSYSTLSRFEREGFRNISTLYDKIESPALTFGSSVDTLLTDGEEAFNESFIVCEFPKISDNLRTIAKDLHRRFKDTHRKIDTIPDIEIDRIAVANNYYANPRYATYRVSNVKESCKEYYNLLLLADTKTILSTDEYQDAIRCAEVLKNSEVTSHFFTINPLEKDIEKVFQLKFKAEYNGIPVRCMFDELIVDHKSKIIYPIDLKTTGHPEEEFAESFSTWRYDIQAKLYTYILQQVIEKDGYFKDFKIACYQFVVINRRTKAPLIWIFDRNFCTKDLVDSKNVVLRDWRKIIDDLEYYRNNSTRYSREAVDNNYIMKIKLDTV